MFAARKREKRFASARKWRASSGCASLRSGALQSNDNLVGPFSSSMAALYLRGEAKSDTAAYSADIVWTFFKKHHSDNDRDGSSKNHPRARIECP